MLAIFLLRLRRLSPVPSMLGVVFSIVVTASNAGEQALDAPLGSISLNPDTVVTRVAFGSCFKAQRPEDRVWDAVSRYKPDLFLFAGDALYPDQDDDSPALEHLRAAYRALAEVRPFERLRQQVPVLPVWDDHDYGSNDGGGDFAFKAESEALFENSWGIEASDPRRSRPGIYFSQTLGLAGQRLQLIVLDTRYFRSGLTAARVSGVRGIERYMPSSQDGQMMLGAAQWGWLEKELGKAADLRIIVSSIQVLADGHGWEGWKQLPAEQAKFFNLLRRHGNTPLVLLSGDRHVAGFYARDIGLTAPLLEFTSSALNNTISFPYRELTLAEAGPFRLGELYGGASFGTLDIDWDSGLLSLAIRSDSGVLLRMLNRRFR
ncbi:MAG: alkaline phosphatase D family protein [Congregibacter sp.]